MSADYLRETAALMRADAAACGYASSDFIPAIADWLDATAARVEAGRDPKQGGRRNHGWRGSREALAAARAYRGEAS